MSNLPRRILLLAIALAATPTLAAPATAPTPAITRPEPNYAGQTPLQTLETYYRPWLIPGDVPLFAIKVTSGLPDPYKYFRGNKDRFNLWCIAHATDWFDGHGGHVVWSHGDLHFGNLGTYPAGPKGGPDSLRFGLVDFDDARQMPFQLELLHARVAVELAAHVAKIDLTDADRQKMTDQLVAGYRKGLTSNEPIERMLADEPAVTALLKPGKGTLASEAAKYTEGDRIKPVIRKGNELRDVFVPWPDKAAVSKALTEAAERDAVFAAELGPKFTVLDAASRIRVASAGSQGLVKLFVLVARQDGSRVLVYMKEQIEPAVDRVGVNAARPGPGITERRRPGPPPDAAEQTHAAMLALTGGDRDPAAAPHATTWATLPDRAAGRVLSFAVSLRDPWSDSLSEDAFTKPAKSDTPDAALQRKARIAQGAYVIGVVAGRSHRWALHDKVTPITELLTPEFVAQLHTRSLSASSAMVADWRNLAADPAAERLKAEASAYFARKATPSN